MDGPPCPVASVVELVLNLSADSILELRCFVEAQAGEDCCSDCQCEVVHFLSPWFVLCSSDGCIIHPVRLASRLVQKEFQKKAKLVYRLLLMP
jgi:hypothetical protein